MTEKRTVNAFRHKLIRDEFRPLLSSERFELPLDTDGVVILSAGPVKVENGKAVESEEDPRNIDRINYGIEIAKRITAGKIGKKTEEVTSEDIVQYGPPLILNALVDSLEGMRLMAKENFPGEKILEVSCTINGSGNTKTQIQVMNTDPRFANAKHFTFISSDYHAPRIARTAAKNLSHKFHFDVIPVPHPQDGNIYRRVKGEIKRIQQYSSRKDITRTVNKKSEGL
ncbi:YdcF family protein [Candidatus Microgenomates bacterium]|nr:MAG: YdcF family protein [Candidatus Microgenomates bacterium]